MQRSIIDWSLRQNVGLAATEQNTDLASNPVLLGVLRALQPVAGRKHLAAEISQEPIDSIDQLIYNLSRMIFHARNAYPHRYSAATF